MFAVPDILIPETLKNHTIKQKDPYCITVFIGVSAVLNVMIRLLG
jgi:hypothetical protein